MVLTSTSENVSMGSVLSRDVRRALDHVEHEHEIGTQMQEFWSWRDKPESHRQMLLQLQRDNIVYMLSRTMNCPYLGQTPEGRWARTNHTFLHQLHHGPVSELMGFSNGHLNQEVEAVHHLFVRHLRSMPPACLWCMQVQLTPEREESFRRLLTWVIRPDYYGLYRDILS